MKNAYIASFTIGLVFFGCSDQRLSQSDAAGGAVAATETASGNVAEVAAYEWDQTDTSASFSMGELYVEINRLVLDDTLNHVYALESDTLDVFIDLGETIEGQELSINDTNFENVVIEQSYETSVTIMNEGPHCDLYDWTHYQSPWVELEKNNKGSYRCLNYEGEDYERFVDVSLEELKAAIARECGEYWSEIAKDIKGPNDYPAGVTISRYFLRISATSKSTQERIQKLIIIQSPMGC